MVILNHLCYASGNSEPGRANPTKAVAKARADNFAAGYLRTGARAVFAIGNGSASYTLRSLFTATMSISSIFATRSGAEPALRLLVRVVADEGHEGLDGPELAGSLLPVRDGHPRA